MLQRGRKFRCPKGPWRYGKTSVVLFDLHRANYNDMAMPEYLEECLMRTTPWKSTTLALCSAAFLLILPRAHAQEVPADAIQKNPTGALGFAISSSNVNVARQALDAGADANGKYSNDTTLLMWASEKGNVEIVKMMLEKGADPKKGGTGGYDPLIVAAKCGKAEAAKALIAAGAEVSAKTEKGYTPIILAGASGSAETVKVLIEAKADVNAQSGSRGMTALIQAAMGCNADAVKLLLEAGAKPGMVDSQGKTALSYAQEMLTHGQRPEAQAVIDLLKDVTPAVTEAPSPAPGGRPKDEVSEEY